MIEDQDSMSDEQIDEIYTRLQNAFTDQICTSTSFRINQLKKLAYAILDNKQGILQALFDDLGQTALEAEVTQYNSSVWICTEYIFTLATLSQTYQPWTSQGPFPLYETAYHRVPLGSALIISPSNHPWKLAIEPFVTAIAAGCPVVLKPAEITPATNAMLCQVIEESLDPRCYAIVEGGFEVIDRLLLHPWGRVLFTGPPTIGRLISIACASTLTPCALDLSSRNPILIDPFFSHTLAAERTLIHTITRFCATSDYVLVQMDKQEEFVNEAARLLAEWYPHGELQSEGYKKMPDREMVKRVERMLDETKGTIVRRGEVDWETMRVGISIVCDVKPDDVLMQEEGIGGPILIVMPMESIDAALRHINSLSTTASGISLFTDCASLSSYVFSRTQSDSFLINDCAHPPHLALLGGGPLASPQSGKWGFDLFTRERPASRVPTWLEIALAARRPPFDDSRRRVLDMMERPALGLPFPRPGAVEAPTWPSSARSSDESDPW